MVDPDEIEMEQEIHRYAVAVSGDVVEALVLRYLAERYGEQWKSRTAHLKFNEGVGSAVAHVVVDLND